MLPSSHHAALHAELLPHTVAHLERRLELLERLVFTLMQQPQPHPPPQLPPPQPPPPPPQQQPPPPQQQPPQVATSARRGAAV